MKKLADRKYAGYAVKFNDSSSVCSEGLATPQRVEKGGRREGGGGKWCRKWREL